MTQFDNIINLAPSQNPQDPLKPTAAPVQPPSPVPLAFDRQAYEQDLRQSARDWIKRDDQNKIDTYLNNLSVAVKENPDDYAEAAQIARELGVDPLAVSENREVLREVAKRRAIFNSNLHETNPVLAESLRSIDFARLASDDIDNLSMVEKFSRSWAAGVLTYEIGDLGFKVMQRTATDDEKRRFAEYRTRLQKEPGAGGIFYGAIERLALNYKMLPEVLIPASAAALVAGQTTAYVGQAPGLTLIPEEVVTVPLAAAATFSATSLTMRVVAASRIEQGFDFADFREMGMGENEAYWAATASGSIKGLLEGAGDYVFAAPFRSMLNSVIKDAAQEVFAAPVVGALVRTAGKEMLVGPLANSLEEGLQEVAKLIVQEGAKSAFDMGLVPAESEQMWNQVRDSFVQAFEASLLPGAVGPSIKFYVDSRKAAEAEARKEAVMGLINGIQTSKLAGRDIGALSGFVQRAAEQNGTPNVYVEADKLQEALGKAGISLKQFETEMPNLANDMRVALIAGGDVVIPMGVFAERFAVNEELATAIEPHLRPTADSWSPFQAEQFRLVEPDLKKAVDKLRKQKEGEERTVYSKEFRDSGELVRKEIASSMKLAGVGTTEEQATFAGLVKNLYEVYAEKAGELPMDAFRKSPFNIAGKAPEGATGGIKSTVGGKVKGEYYGDLNLAVFSKKADFSTFAHELGHHYRKMLFNIAGSMEGPTVFAADTQTLLNAWGVKDLDEWNGLDNAKKEKFEEQFARWFEGWLATGEAPTVEMEGLFRRFKNWLKRIYRDVMGRLNEDYRAQFGEDLPSMPGEIRTVFEHMLATDADIERAQAVRGFIDVVGFAEQARNLGLDTESEEWVLLRELAKQSHETALDILNRESVRNMQWVKNASIRIKGSQDEQIAKTREKVRKEVEKQVEGFPLYKVILALKGGKVEGEGGQMVDQRLDRDAVEDILSDMFAREVESAATRNVKKDAKQVVRRMERAREKLGFGRGDGMVVKGGQSPAVTASMFSFKDQEQMLRAILAAPDDLNTLTDELVDNIMVAQHSDLVDPVKREEAIAKALANEAHAKFLNTKLAFLSRAKRPERVLRGAAKSVAQRVLAEARVSEIAPKGRASSLARSARAAESRAAANVLNAMREGKAEDAVVFTQQEIVQHELTKLALSAKAEVKKAKDLFAKFNQPPKKIAKSRNMDFVNAGRLLLSRVGAAAPLADEAKFVDGIAADMPEFHRSFLNLLEYANEVGAASRGDVENLTYEQLLELRDYAKSLWEMAKKQKEFELDGKRVELDALIGQFTETLAKKSAVEFEGIFRSLTDRQKGRIDIEQLASSLAMIEPMLRYLDGGKQDGIFTRAIWRKVSKALEDGRLVAKDLVKPLAKRFEALSKDMEFGDKSFKSIPHIFASDAEILGVIANCGNDGNLERAALNRKDQDGNFLWGDVLEDGSVDTSKVLAFVQEAADRGILTEERMDFIQSMWNQMEAIKPLSQKAHKQIHGYEFEEVEARPLRIRFKDGKVKLYPGGYMPLRYDEYLSSEATKAQKLEDLNADSRNTRPQTKSDFTKSRVAKLSRPMRFDISVSIHHIEEAVRFAYMEPVVVDLLKVFRDKRFVAAMRRVAPQMLDEILIPWLNRAARQITSTPTSYRGMDRVLNKIRTNTAMQIMFANVPNTAQQITGIPIAWSEMPVRYSMSGVMQAFNRSTYKFVSENSPAMRNRMEDEMRLLAEEIQESRNEKTAFRAIQRAARRKPYFLQVMVQHPLDIAVWKGKYDYERDQMLKAIPATATAEEQKAAVDAAHTEAVLRADAAVRLTQGSRNPESIARYESGPAAVKLVAQFAGWSNMVGNNNYWKLKEIYDDLGWKGGAPKMAYHFLVTFSVPMILGALVVNFLSGRGVVPKDEDDNGWADEAAIDYLLLSHVKGLMSMAPIIGNAAMAVIGAWTDKPYDDRILQAPAMTLAESGLRATARLFNAATGGDTEIRGRDIKDFAGVLGTGLGVPLLWLGKPASYVADVVRGDIEPTDSWDFIRGFVTGSPSPESKR